MNEALCGMINVLKPPGMTSSQVVSFIRRTLHCGHVGHTGTLDPDAAGVLPVCVGKATRLFDYIVDKDKEYVTRIVFGKTTDTLDISGTVTEEKETVLTEEAVRAVLPRFTGEILQVPPMVSAVHINGERLYKLAREGEKVELPPRPVTVYELTLLRLEGPDTALFRVVCSRGTYIRALARDLGQALGTVAAVSFLLRTRSGVYSIEDALTLEEIARRSEQEGTASVLSPMDAALLHLPRADWPDEQYTRLINGNPLPGFADEGKEGTGPVRIYCRDALMAIGTVSPEGCLTVKTLLTESGNTK